MSLAESLESLRKVDLADLDLNNLGSWPAPVKFITGVIVLAAVLGLGYYFHLQDLQLQHEQHRAQEVTLKQQFSTKAFQAANPKLTKSRWPKWKHHSVRCFDSCQAIPRSRAAGRHHSYWFR